MKNTKKDILFEVPADGELLECVRTALSSSFNRGKLKSNLQHRLISVDGVVQTQYNFPVRKGQTIRMRQSVSSSFRSPLEVVYEDDAMLAVNKPAGLLTVATDKEKEITAIRLLRNSGIEPLYVVHRLDRDTSGVLLFAKSMEVRDALQNTWDEVKRREYLAVCEGVFEQKRGRLETFLRETSTHLVYSASDGDGKRAVTNYEVLKQNKLYSFLRVRIETGRKNQIRVHMKELGHPIVGDKKYGAQGSPLGRLGLHASLLELVHPQSGQPLVIEASAGASFRLPRENR